MRRETLRDTAVSSGAEQALAASSAERDREVGRVVATRYVLQAYLGESRYGRVYSALDREMSEPRLRLECHVGLHLLDGAIRSQTQVLRKLETGWRQPDLWSHPNIVKILDFGADRGSYYLATELLEGSSLRMLLDRVRPNLLSRSAAFALLRAVGDALSYAHARGVVHGDIRPEKIFVTTDGIVKVLDLLPASPARRVPYFVEDSSPEGPAGQDTRDDVYGLACLAYELLSGSHPFHGASPIQASKDRLAPAPIAGLGMGRWESFARGLALRRARRPTSVTEFLVQLGVVDSGAADDGRAESNGPEAPARPARVSTADDVPVARSDSSRPRAQRVVTEAVPALSAHDPGAPWAFSEPVVSARDVDTYRGRAERPKRSAAKGRGALIVALALVAVIVGGFATYDERARGMAEQWLHDLTNAFPHGSASVAAPDNALPAGARAADGAAAAPSQTSAPTLGAEPAVGTEAATAKPSVLTEHAGVDTRVPPEVGGVQAPTTTATANATAPTAVPAQAAAAEVPASAPVHASEAADSREPATPAVPAVAARPAGAPEDAPASTGVDSGDAAADTGPSSFEFAAQTVIVAESQPAATLRIRRRGGLGASATVTWWTSPGTAVAGEDYADLGRQEATFAPGQDTLTIYVPLVSDSVPEPRESFQVSLAAGRVGDTSLAPTAQAEVVIDDDD